MIKNLYNDQKTTKQMSSEIIDQLLPQYFGSIK